MEDYRQLKQAQFDDLAQLCDDYVSGRISSEIISQCRKKQFEESYFLQAVYYYLDSSTCVVTGCAELDDVLSKMHARAEGYQKAYRELRERISNAEKQAGSDYTAMEQYQAELYEIKQANHQLYRETYRYKKSALARLAAVQEHISADLYAAACLHAAYLESAVAKLQYASDRTSDMMAYLRYYENYAAQRFAYLHYQHECELEKQAAAFKFIIQKYQFYALEHKRELTATKLLVTYLQADIKINNDKQARLEEQYGDLKGQYYAYAFILYDLKDKLQESHKEVQDYHAAQAKLKVIIQKQRYEGSALRQRIRYYEYYLAQSKQEKLRLESESHCSTNTGPSSATPAKHSIAEQLQDTCTQECGLIGSLQVSELGESEILPYKRYLDYSVADQEYTALQKSLIDMKTQLELLESQPSDSLSRSAGWNISQFQSRSYHPLTRYFARSQSIGLYGSTNVNEAPKISNYEYMRLETLYAYTTALKKQVAVYAKINDALNKKLAVVYGLRH